MKAYLGFALAATASLTAATDLQFTSYSLSGPHMAAADRAGFVYIADKDAHAIRKTLLDGTIVTVAGTNGPGNAPDEAVPDNQAPLAEPNGLWVKADGTLFILDLLARSHSERPPPRPRGRWRSIPR